MHITAECYLDGKNNLLNLLERVNRIDWRHVKLM